VGPNGLPWFSTKGQVIDLLLKMLLAVLAGFDAWPKMKQNEFLSAGALLFYALVAVVMATLALLIGVLRQRRRGIPGDEQEAANARAARVLALRNVI